ncbi:MAG: hypothetical protein K9N62_07070 [Verrucomicrobia bacterium]|nr:hypothetical protein [Verrucomicrobiota bacterium]
MKINVVFAGLVFPRGTGGFEASVRNPWNVILPGGNWSAAFTGGAAISARNVPSVSAASHRYRSVFGVFMGMLGKL